MADRVVVAVMGVTGSGKSSFIKRITGRSDIVVGDNLSSETEAVHTYDFSYKGVDFTLVDTPGFDDSRGSDRKIMRTILSWLEKSYKQGTKLNGLVYLHRIIDPRMPGSAMSNLRMFRSLCGADNFKNVVLATTFWGQVSIAEGETREDELRTNSAYWGEMIAKDAKMMRMEENRESNLDILMHIARNNGKILVEAQKEMIAGKSILETTTALIVNEDVERWKREREAELEEERERLRQGMERKARRQRERFQQEQARVLRQFEEAKKIEEAERQRLAKEEEERAEQEWEAERKRRQEELEATQKRLEELQLARQEVAPVPQPLRKRDILGILAYCAIKAVFDEV